MSEYCIDTFEYKEDLWDLDLKYVNMLYYVKEEYGIRVQDLAKIFSTTRQTINNYFKKTSDELPIKVKRLIVEIYNCNSFDEVLEKEYEVISGNHNIRPILSDSITFHNNSLTLDEDVPREYLNLYELDLKSDTYCRLKEKYDYGLLWYKATRGYSTLEKNQNVVSEQGMPSILKKHSKEYAELIIKYLSKVVEDDFSFLSLISEYLSNE